MKREIAYILGIAAMLFTSCQKENVATTEAPYNGEVRLTSGIALTRASGTTWAQDDKVGIFMLDHSAQTNLSVNIQHNNSATSGASATFRAVTSNETIYYPQTGTVDLFGYYPFQSGMENDLYNVNVLTQKPLVDIDLMVSDKKENIAKNKSPQNLDFKHKLSNIVLTFNEGAGVAIGELTAITATIEGTYPTATYDLKNNSGFTNVASATQDIEMVVTNSGATAEALVIPQTTTSGVTLKFSIPTVGKFATSLPADLDPGTDGAQVAFESGTKYTFSVTINRTAVGLGAKITDWTTVDGGNLDGNEVI